MQNILKQSFENRYQNYNLQVKMVANGRYFVNYCINNAIETQAFLNGRNIYKLFAIFIHIQFRSEPNFKISYQILIVERFSTKHEIQNIFKVIDRYSKNIK